VLIGPGGVGKGTVAKQLTARDPLLWLSRSWTSRPRRVGEDADAYVFVDRATFEKHVAENGFLEWAEFLGHLYGTPHPHAPSGSDVLLEIDLQGATQIKELYPGATVILLTAPSEEAQRERMALRGDDAAHIAERIAKGVEEVEAGKPLASHIVVNDDLERVVGEVAGILDAIRSSS
jgi:guanylate kinase